MRTFVVILACVVAINIFVLPEMDWFTPASWLKPTEKEEPPQAQQLQRTVQKSNHPRPVAAQQVVHLNIGQEPPSLDPRHGIDSVSSNILKSLFDGLTRLNVSGEPEPSVADSIDISADHKTYIFHLRESYWSDGTRVTAQDFEYAWKKVLDPTFDSARPDGLYVVKNAQAAKKGEISLDEIGVYAADQDTLVVALEHPYPSFLALLANPECMPVPMHVDQATPHWMREADSYVSNGPFRLKSWRHNYEITLERNPTYWDADDVRLETVHYMMVEDAQTELSMFEMGELQWAGQPLSSLPPEALPTLREQGLLEVQPLTATYLFLLNTTKEPFSNNKFRQALSYGINRQALVEHVTQGGQIPALRLLPPIIGMQDRAYFRDNDVEKAQNYLREALKEMGTTLEDLPQLTLSYNTLEVNKQVALMLQQEWKRNLGLNIRLENADWKVHLSRMYKHQYEMSRYGAIATVNDAMDLLQNFSRGIDDAGNISPWQHYRYHELLTQARKAAIPSEREELLLEAERVFMEEMPAIPIYHYTIAYVRSPKLRDVPISPQGIADLKWAWMQKG